MSASLRTPQLRLFPLKDEFKSIYSTAQTVSRAFSEDPLIRWLRPNGSPWSEPNVEVSKWQCRRIQHAVADGSVFHAEPVSRIERTFPRRGAISSSPSSSTTMEKAKEIKAEIKEEEGRQSAGDSGAVVILFPPRSQKKWSLQRILLACKLWFLDLLDGVQDGGAKESRLDKLMEAHDASLSHFRNQVNLWYLEVIAVHPDLQARGLGGMVMRWILDHVGDQPVCLECTREENVGFYEKFGFHVVEKVVLEDGGDKVVYWMMLRE